MNVTYLIGAGASAQAIPTVREFNTRFVVFIDLLKDSDPTINPKVAEFYKTVKEDVPTHYSVDTYARKLLFLKDEKYNAFKTLLSYYFLFEQMKGSENLLAPKAINDKENILKQLCTKKDPRYDAFFAALIKKDTERLSDNLSVISWNYDMQFELAFAEFLNIPITHAFKKLTTFPSPSSEHPSYSNRAKFLKLNGVAGIYYYENIDTRSSGYQMWIDPKSGTFNNNELFQCNKAVDKDLNSFKRTEKSLLEFAWDDETEVTQARERAKNILFETDSLIVIGYSFPNYNRTIDKYIFSEFTPLRTKEIRLQVSNEDFEACNERFRSCLPMKLHHDFVQKVHYRDLFYIDNSLL